MLVLLASVATVAGLVILNRQAIGLSLAFLLAERRPALLADARWGDASSAHQFEKRFKRGVPERELTAWLKKYRFKVGPAGHASKLVSSLPCNEHVSVDWTDDTQGRLERATVLLSEAGCL
jgi:hypothetical protein